MPTYHVIDSHTNDVVCVGPFTKCLKDRDARNAEIDSITYHADGTFSVAYPRFFVGQEGDKA